MDQEVMKKVRNRIANIVQESVLFQMILATRIIKCNYTFHNTSQITNLKITYWSQNYNVKTNLKIRQMFWLHTRGDFQKFIIDNSSVNEQIGISIDFGILKRLLCLFCY